MTREPTLLLVDDDEDLLKLLTIRLKGEGFHVKTAASGQAALKILTDLRPAAVITDLRMQGLNGIELLTEIKSRFPVLPVILLTAHGTIPDAVKATAGGAFAFLVKPINNQELISQVHAAVGPACAGQSGDTEDGGQAWRNDIVTQSPLMETVLREAELAAASDVSILLHGESGTGKELLARAIHKASPRAANPCVTVNCSAIAETLFESEVFGHTKGSFTGAYRDKPGLFRQAEHGTLFLDEVGDLPAASQVKLLRALQERSVRPVGADQDVAVDVRVIAATHHDLEQAVKQNRFREDLFYRLNVIRLKIPPLEERREDIPLLVDHFLRASQDKGPVRGFSKDALELLATAPWPGNIRQLANVVQHCVVLCRSQLVPASLVERAMSGKAERLTSFAAAREQFEFEYLSRLLKTAGGNVSQAARIAERNRSEFYKLLKKHELDPADFRENEADD